MPARMAGSKALTHIFIFFCTFGAVLGQQNKSPFYTQPWNIKGDVLILDVGSLSFQGNHPAFPPFGEEGCADACARTPGCNAWTYCSSKEGCGSCCKAYIAQNPQLPTASGPDANPTIPNPAWTSLPRITGFGPWGVTGNCKYECDNSGNCKPGDKWPYGMCSLKKLANADKPEFWSNNPAEGFVSGFAKQPPECANIPIRACTRCIRSQDPANCLKCANNPAFKVGMLEGAYSNFLTKADGCSSCYDSSDPAKCLDCLTGDAPCGQCALQQPDASVKMDVTACINCTQKHGEKFRDACTQCSFLGAKQQQMTQCLSCLDTMKPLACDKTGYQPGCWNPAVSSYACVTCASTGQSYDTCLACMKTTPYSSNCEVCPLLEPSKQETCYRCSKAAAHPGSGCYDCLQSLTDPGQLGQCLGCLANPKIGREGKQWCYGCQNWCGTYATRGKCVACLGTPQDAYMTACACSN